MNLHKPNLPRAIGLKILSALLFALMSALVRQLGDVTPVGEMVFFRSAFAIPPLVIIYALRGQLLSMLYTSRPFGQFGRGLLSLTGMFTNFSALTRLPLADATAIGFAAPLITVAMAALILKEKVRVFRWTAVIVGFVGVVVMMLPHLDFAQYAAIGGAAAAVGVLFAIISAFCTAGTIIQTRRLTQSETTSSIVFYFSLVCALFGALAFALCLVHADAFRADHADRARCARRPCPYLPHRELSLRVGLGDRAIRLHGAAVGAFARLLDVRRIAGRVRLCRLGDRCRRGLVCDLA